MNRLVGSYALASLVSIVLLGITPMADACFPCVQIPGTNITLTPLGPAPTPVVQKTDEVVNKTIAPAVQQAGQAALSVATAPIAPQVQVFNVISGQETLGSAAAQFVQGQATSIKSVGDAISAANAADKQIKVIAAKSIGGEVGKTIMTISTGPERLSVDFAATSVIESGELLGGKLRPEELIASPLAAAIRSAQLQFLPSSKPLPANVKATLAPYYSADVLEAARWTVGSVSISVPDMTNQARKTFEDIENAVTVGNVTVFAVDPGTSYHWWAHELQHQVQYHEWGIDDFAYRYVTSCHDVETDAETHAESAVPAGETSLGC